MESRCRCSHPPADTFGELGSVELGCIECGRTCCMACGVWVESVMYCVRCSRDFRDVLYRTPGRVERTVA